MKIDLNEEIKDIISDLELIITESEAEINVETLPAIDADPFQLRQLLTNIVNNGLKYHRQDVPPVINVSTQIIKSTNSSLYKSKNIDMVQLTISDNGIGFDKKYADRIFEPFQRLHGRNEFEGTGIGLAICKKIVERHEGSINAKSKEGEGSEFIIQLPINQKK